MAKMRTTISERIAAKPLMTSLCRQPGSRRRRWCLAMPAPAIVKPVKTPTAYTRDEDVQSGLGPDEQQFHRDDGEDDDPVREHEPVPAAGELARQERVLGHEAREVGKSVEARVAPRLEDQHRRALDEVVAELPDEGRSEDVPRLLGEHRRAADQIRHGVGDVTPAAKRPRRALPRMIAMMTSTRRAFRPSGGRKLETPFEIASRPVNDDPPLRERAHARLGATPRTKARSRGCRRARRRRRRDRVGVQLSEGRPDQPDDDQRPSRRDEQVGRQGEDPPGLADASQVAVAHDGDDDERYLEVPSGERRERPRTRRRSRPPPARRRSRCSR